MQENRVVITGLGVVAPNALGRANFLAALQSGKSGISYRSDLEELQFACRVAGCPPLTEEYINSFLTPLQRRYIQGSGLLYGCLAGLEAWQDAALPISEKKEEPDWESGCIFGGGQSSIEVVREGIYKVDAGKVRRIGSSLIQQTMESSISAYLGGFLGLGNQLSSNSAACSTGSEAILMGYDRIRLGRAERMLVGSCNSSGPYIWAGFDSMRVLCRKFNDRPEQASRPMSERAAGFVPGSGAGALVLESLASAQARGARIYAELKGGHLNAGGQRQGGSMTAPNIKAIERCIRLALADAGISAQELDAISGHLTATMGDPAEIGAWLRALGRSADDFPKINSLKSLIGHCLSAAGAIESVAVVLQLVHGFLHPSKNAEDLHPEIAAQISAACIPLQTEAANLRYMAKASFGFGDVNSCLLFARWEGE
ncbi:3-oxoacyl-(acyl-carrier-protein) synthase [Saprospira grandis DSM 2844]|uniref:3-oxoacyl-[acyl-carrier-protein] synthase 1 n=1 Tax=Saprospira grandis DSM 2844 TaxID=694433 RepID=J0P1W9_9BACT|nr:3-oxoacyl-(acyl-carrier-protein) synthase [Saprospira grandis DSM 2844]